ncbi:MAG: phosphatase PAP2 family protein [Acidimicrobiales bacterium]
MGGAANRRGARVGEVVAVVGGGALLAGSWMAVAIDERVPIWEARVFDALNGLPGGIWPVVWLPMQTGSLIGSIVVVGATGLASRDTRLTLAALVASQAGYWSAKGVKGLVSRGRPSAFLADVHVREKVGGLGYASGHAAVAFALAAVLAPSLPARWRPVAFVIAAVVALARVYGGVHLPLDVVGGTGLGLLCGVFSRWAFGLGGEGLPPRVSRSARGAPR